MSSPLSVVIPCKNEARNILQCIESVRNIADELVVADSGSTDRTMEKVREYGGCRIVEREFISFSSFKGWAISQATHPWVLTLDADERLTPAAAEEIRDLLACVPACDGYELRRCNHFLGYPLRYGPASNDWTLRLFRKRVASYNDRNVHESLQIATGRVGRLRSPMLHYSDWTLADYFSRYHRYTDLAAAEMHQRGRRAGFFKLLTVWPLHFLKYYVLKRGFLDGVPGLVACLLSSSYATTKYIKLWGMSASLERSSIDPAPIHGPTTSQDQAA